MVETEDLEKIKEKDYKIYDEFLKDYLNELNELGAPFNCNFLIRDFDRTRIDNVFLITVFERIGIFIGYNYRVRVHRNNWFNRFKAKKYVSKNFITKNWFDEGKPAYVTGDLMVAAMMKKYKYSYIHNMMKEILEEYYGIEDFS